VLEGGEDENERHGLDGSDTLSGGQGRGVIYGGPGIDMLWSSPAMESDDSSKNVLYGRLDRDEMYDYDILYGAKSATPGW
jgi:Ca2+-binding RTX toxin-like protein